MWRSQAWAPVIFCSSGICRERTTTLRRWNKSSGISPNSTGLTARPSCFPWRCDWLTGNKKLKSNIWCTECEKHCYSRLEMKSYNRPCKCIKCENVSSDRNVWCSARILTCNKRHPVSQKGLLCLSRSFLMSEKIILMMWSCLSQNTHFCVMNQRYVLKHEGVYKSESVYLGR